MRMPTNLWSGPVAQLVERQLCKLDVLGSNPCGSTIFSAPRQPAQARLLGMKKLTLVARLLLGIQFLVFGLNAFFHFIPMPQDMPEAAVKFATAMGETGFLNQLVHGVQVVAGLMLLSGFQIPLALLFLAPVAVNILLFHWFLTGPATIGMSVFIIVLMVVLAKAHWANFAPLFQKKA